MMYLRIKSFNLLALILFVSMYNCGDDSNVVKKSIHNAKKQLSNRVLKQHVIPLKNGDKEIGTVYIDSTGKRIKHGDWKRLDVKGTVLEQGKYVDDKKTGTWITFYPNLQKKSEMVYLKGRRQGHFKKWTANGKLVVHGLFLKDRPHGPWKWWFVNGKRDAHGIYHMGRRQGEWIYYWQNGPIKAKGKFEHGRPVGEWTGTDSIGVKYTISFPGKDGRNGEITGKFSNGKPLLKLKLVKGSIIGKATLYYSNGKLRRKGNFIKINRAVAAKKKLKPHLVPFHVYLVKKNFFGIPDGTLEQYYRNGQLKRLTTFKNGETTGEHKQFYIDGSKKLECMYNKGNIVEGSFTSWDKNGKVLEKK